MSGGGNKRGRGIKNPYWKFFFEKIYIVSMHDIAFTILVLTETKRSISSTKAKVKSKM